MHYVEDTQIFYLDGLKTVDHVHHTGAIDIRDGSFLFLGPLALLKTVCNNMQGSI